MTDQKQPTYTVTVLARALGVTHPQVSAWKAAGMPFKSGRITLAAAVHWLRNDARRERPRVGAGEANERRAAAEAELAELKLARERGDVVPAADVYAQAEEEATRVRSALTQMASQHAPMVASRLGCGLREASAVLRELADAVSAGLSTDDVEEEAA
jgi:phage terminase Nu1 subunit (DNA packaging protein)